VAYCSSMDTPGIFTRTVEDAAIMLDVLAGNDEKDSTMDLGAVRTGSYRKSLLQSMGSLAGVRVGIPREYYVSELDSEIVKLWESVALILKELGAEVSEVSLPHTRHSLAAYYILATAEASSNLARYDGLRL